MTKPTAAEETYIRRVERIARETREFFGEGIISGGDVERIAAIAADLMAKALSGQTIAAAPEPESQERYAAREGAAGIWYVWDVSHQADCNHFPMAEIDSKGAADCCHEAWAKRIATALSAAPETKGEVTQDLIERLNKIAALFPSFNGTGIAIKEAATAISTLQAEVALAIAAAQRDQIALMHCERRIANQRHEISTLSERNKLLEAEVERLTKEGAARGQRILEWDKLCEDYKTRATAAEAKVAELKLALDECERGRVAARDEWNAAEAQAMLLRRVIAWANNSLFGSHGPFLSTNGGPPDEHHLDRPIEELKARSNQQWRRAESAEAQVRELREALSRSMTLLRDELDDYMAGWQIDKLFAREGFTAALSPREASSPADKEPYND